MHWFKHYPGDYLTATLRLTMTEDGAYRRLMDEYYSTEEPLPLDKAELYLAARAVKKDEQDAVDKIVSRYFTKADDGYHQKRIDTEIDKANKQAETNRRIAAEREERRKASKPSDEPLNEASDEEGTLLDSRHQTSDSRPSDSKTKDKDIPSAAAKLPPGPHERIIEMYHKNLPMNPIVRTWTAPSRRGNLQARWREHPDMKWWLWYFQIISQSPFLTGKVPGKNGRKPFIAKLSWLINPTNMAEIIEEKYHG